MVHQSIPAPVALAAQHARQDLQLAGDVLAGWAPGRVNLIGEHTDYNDGWVLPVAVDRVVALAGQTATSPDEPEGSRPMDVRLFSVHHGEMATFSASHPPTASDSQDVPLWARYIGGIVAEAREAGYPVRGFTAAIAGDVPVGGGMSSSAALSVATLTWLDAAFHLGLDPLALARLAQRAETRGSGVRVGILDQAASVLGRPGQAALIDCRSLAYSYIPFNLPDIGLLICETGVERSLASTGYNQRRSECEQAVAALAHAVRDEGDPRDIVALRDVSELDFLRLAGHISEPARYRARHVITENVRTLRAVEALKAGDAVAFGRLVLESHASLRDDYAVSCPELDAVVEIATSIPGTLGARLVGAGFGGSALIVARTEDLDAITSALQERYPLRSGLQPQIHRVTAAGGTGFAYVSS